MKACLRLAIIILVCLAPFGKAYGQPASAIDAAQQKISKQSMRETVSEMTDPKCLGRMSGSKEMSYVWQLVAKTFYVADIRPTKGLTFTDSTIMPEEKRFWVSI